MTDKQIKRLYDTVLSIETKLSFALQELGLAVSARLGKDVIADLCNGGEIEFRETLEDGSPDTTCCIRLEDVLKQKGE